VSGATTIGDGTICTVATATGTGVETVGGVTVGVGVAGKAVISGNCVRATVGVGMAVATRTVGDAGTAV
jgi:hypothetical protein